MANKGNVFAPRITNHPAMVVNKTAKHAPKPAGGSTPMVRKRTTVRTKK